MRNVLVAVFVVLQPLWSHAQAPINLKVAQTLPSAPLPQANPNQIGLSPNGQQPSLPQADPGMPESLSLAQAEALALKNNPQISVARLTAMASQQVTREVRSNLWPAATANLTGVDARDNSRITPADSTIPLFISAPPLASW